MRIPFTDERALEGRAGRDEREGAVVRWLEELYATADALRRQHESDWVTNILFVAGNQWEQASADVRRFSGRTPIAPPQSKVKFVTNMVYPMMRQAAAAFRDNLARQVAVPATVEPADIAAAEVASDFLEQRHYDIYDDESELRLREILWAMVAGQVLRATEWDPRAPGHTLAGRQDGLGDLRTRAVNPFRFLLCPWFDDSGALPWVIEVDVRDVAEINDLFPGHDVQPEGYASALDALDRLAVNIVESADMRTPRRHNSAALKRLYIAPRPDLPQGRYYVWANGKLLWPRAGEESRAALPEGELPYVALRWFPIPARVYALPFVSPLRGLQVEINTTLSQLIELKNRQLRGDVVMAGSGQPKQVVHPASGRKVLVLPPNVSKFEFMRYDLNANEAETLLARFWNHFMQVAGMHEPTIGQTPGKAATATQITILREQDLAGLTLFRSGFDAAYSKVARLKLLLARNHYHVPRLLRVVGEGNALRVGAFFGADLGNTEDVRPRPVPLLTEAQKQQVRQEAVAQGLFTLSPDPVEQVAKVTALLATGLPGIEEEVEAMIAPTTLDELKAMAAELSRMRWELAAKLTAAELANLDAAMPAPGGDAGGEGGPPMPGGPEAGILPGLMAPAGVA